MLTKQEIRNIVGTRLPNISFRKFVITKGNVPSRGGPKTTNPKRTVDEYGNQKLILDQVARSEDKNLNIGIVMVLRDLGAWFEDEFMKKYLKIQIIQSTQEEKTKKLQEGKIKFFEFKKEVDDVDLKKVVIDIRKLQSLNEFEKIIVNNNIVYQIPYRTLFNSNTTDHITYFAGCFVDTIQMRKDGLLRGDPTAKVKRRYVGEVSSNTLFNKGKMNTSRDVYFDKDGTVWNGKPNSSLTRYRTTNSLIHDLRLFGFLDAQSFLQSEPESKRRFISDMFLSKDRRGGNRFIFSIDLINCLKRKSAVPQFFSNESLAGMILRRTRISNIEIFRSQQGQREILVSSHDKGGKLLQNRNFIDTNNDGRKDYFVASVSEENLNISKRYRNISVYDNSFIDKNDGLYQYGFRIMIEDETQKIAQDILKEIRELKEELKEYYSDGTKNFDSRYVTFKKDFIRKIKQVNGIDGNLTPDTASKEEIDKINGVVWNRVPRKFIKLFSMFTNMSNDRIAGVTTRLQSLIRPSTGTPQAVKSLIDFMERVESKIKISLSTQDNEDQLNDLSFKASKGGLQHTHISATHTFPDAVSASEIKSYGLDYWGVQTESMYGLSRLTAKNANSRVSNNNIELSQIFYSSGKYNVVENDEAKMRKAILALLALKSNPNNRKDVKSVPLNSGNDDVPVYELIEEVNGKINIKEKEKTHAANFPSNDSKDNEQENVDCFLSTKGMCIESKTRRDKTENSKNFFDSSDKLGSTNVETQVAEERNIFSKIQDKLLVKDISGQRERLLEKTTTRFLDRFDENMNPVWTDSPNGGILLSLERNSQIPIFDKYITIELSLEGSCVPYKEEKGCPEGKMYVIKNDNEFCCPEDDLGVSSEFDPLIVLEENEETMDSSDIKLSSLTTGKF